jgi:hypothetical protein
MNYRLGLLYLLHIHQFSIKPILRYKAVMCPSFYDGTFLQYYDLVGMPNGAKPMRYNNRGTVAH